MSAAVRAHIQATQDHLVAMDAAHAAGHDPCNCITADERTTVDAWLARKTALADLVDAAAPLPRDPVAYLSENFSL